MTEQEREVKQSAEEPKAEDLLEAAVQAVRKALLAGIGALDLAREEAEKTMERLAVRGEKARDERRKRLKEALSRRRARAARWEAKVDESLCALMRRLNVPTKSDLEALSEKVEELSRKIDALQRTPPAA